MKKFFKKDGGKNVEFSVILNDLLINGVTAWIEYDDEKSSIEWKSLTLREGARFYINNGNARFTESKAVIFNAKDMSITIDSKYGSESIPTTHTFKVTESDLEILFEGVTWKFKKF